MDPRALRSLFSACDVDGSGRIEFRDFSVVCRELRVPEPDIHTLFLRFDPHQDGYIDYDRFASRFQEVSESLDLASFGTGTGTESVGLAGAVVPLSDSLLQQLSSLRLSILSSGNKVLLQSYQDLVQSLTGQSLENRLQCEQLETSLKRVEETSNSRLTELEEDFIQQVTRAEERAREEERQKAERIVASMQRKHEDEVADLHAAVERLLKSREESNRKQSKEEVKRLNRQIGDLSQENQQLRSSLFQSQLDVPVLHGELDKLKDVHADQKAQHERETEELRTMVLEYQTYCSQLQQLQAVNKTLCDSNDGLRAALAREVIAAKRRQNPQNELPTWRTKPVRQSTLIYTNSSTEADGRRCSRVASWADRYLDGRSPQHTDASQSSGSDYDSDDSRSSVETVHHSYSCVPSEISEGKSEAAVSVTPSRASSIASSLRRRLSAFSTRPSVADIAEGEDAPPVFRLVLAGDAGSGKSSFLLRLTLNQFRKDIQTTLGVDFQLKKMLVDGQKTDLQIWDTAGQERFRSVARSYFRKADGVLLLYDVTSESSFLNVREWVDQIEDSAEGKLPMCVVGNKVDLREELPEGRCVSALQGEKMAKAYGALFCETSAKEGTNVVEAVLHLAREVKKNVTQRRDSDSQVRLNQTLPTKTLSSCCGL